MMKSTVSVARAGMAIVMIAALAACGESTAPSGTANVQIVLTDAPSDYIGSAMVDIGAVELRGSGDTETIVMSEDGTDGPVDLLDLQGLTTQVLADENIPAGTYSELRLIVESASVTLADGYTFRDGSVDGDLTVPSGASSGIKLKLRSDVEGGQDVPEGQDAGGIEISGGETVLVVDFDVNRSFRIQGNPNTPAGINGVHFQPTLRVVVQDVAGSISGTVSTAIDTVGVEGLVVTAETVDPGNDAEFQSQTATTTTDADGAYTIHFLAPGTYNVTVEPPDGFAVTPDSTEVEVAASDDVTAIDFEIVQS